MVRGPLLAPARGAPVRPLSAEGRWKRPIGETAAESEEPRRKKAGGAVFRQMRVVGAWACPASPMKTGVVVRGELLAQAVPQDGAGWHLPRQCLRAGASNKSSVHRSVLQRGESWKTVGKLVGVVEGGSERLRNLMMNHLLKKGKCKTLY